MMTRSEIINKVGDLLIVGQYDPLRMDSIELVQLTLDLEDAFGVEIDDDEMESLKEVEDIYSLIERKKHEQATHGDC